RIRRRNDAKRRGGVEGGGYAERGERGRAGRRERSMTTKHTPGPWAVRYDYVVQAPSFDDGRLAPVAQPYGVNSDGTDLFANARLIAAAPELLAALTEAEVFMAGFEGDELQDGIDAKLQQARAAIAKALGHHPTPLPDEAMAGEQEID